MKRFLFALALASAAVPAFAADIGVGVSISIGDPNFYGRIDIGDFPQPRLVYRRPIVIERVVVVREPLYLRVPPGHAKNWGKHCRQYNACGRPVYFVEDGWYNEVYAPRYRERHGNHDRRESRDDRDGYRDNDDRDHDRGHDDDHGHHDKRNKHKD